MRTSILHALLYLLIEIKRRCSGSLHKGQRVVASSIEGSVFIVGEGLDVVKPIWHTHIDRNLQQPICS